MKNLDKVFQLFLCHMTSHSQLELGNIQIDRERDTGLYERHSSRGDPEKACFDPPKPQLEVESKPIPTKMG